MPEMQRIALKGGGSPASQHLSEMRRIFPHEGKDQNQAGTDDGSFTPWFTEVEGNNPLEYRGLGGSPGGIKRKNPFR